MGSDHRIRGRKSSEFYERFSAALLSLQPGNKTLKEIITHESFDSAPFEFMKFTLKAFNLYSLSNSPAAPQAYALVVDDAHLIKSDEMKKQFVDMIRELPENLVLFILSRSEPPDSFSELIVKDLMAIVDIERLRFSESEIRAFFTSRDRLYGTSLASQYRDN